MNPMPTTPRTSPRRRLLPNSPRLFSAVAAEGIDEGTGIVVGTSVFAGSAELVEDLVDEDDVELSLGVC